MKTRLLTAVAISSCWICLIVAAKFSSARAADTDRVDCHTLAQSIYLGRVEVHGQKNINEALQAIKIGLQPPYSTDPKMANAVVCRLVPAAGNHTTDHFDLRHQSDFGSTARRLTSHDGCSSNRGSLDRKRALRVRSVLHAGICRAQPGIKLPT